MPSLRCLWVVLAACGVTETDPSDGRDDTFLADGKADGVSEGTPGAIGVLRVVNEVSLRILDDDVGLDRRAATGIVKRRDGADKLAGTADDNLFDTLAELDAVPYVGALAFTRLHTYAVANGYVPEPTGTVSTCPGLAWPGTSVCGHASWEFERPSPSGQDLEAAISFGSNDIWAVGDAGTVMHFDGTAWLVEQTPSCETLHAVWGTSATDLWAVGDLGRVLHRGANGWRVIDAGTCEGLKAVWGSPGGDVWISGYHGTLLRGSTQGLADASFDPHVGFEALWGFADDDIWGVTDGRIFHYDGTSWTKTTEGDWSLHAIWGSDPQHLFVAGFSWDDNSAAAFTFTPATAATPTMKLLSGNRVARVSGTSATDVWFAAANNTWHHDGTTWRAMWTGTTEEINAIVPTGTNDVWALGELAARLRWNGTAWIDTTQSARGQAAIWATSANDVWIARSRGVSHFDGTTWTDVAGVSGFFNDVWASSATNVWLAGSLNKVMRFDGQTWTQVTMPVSGHWYSVGGTSATDVWIGGDKKLANWNGSAWTTHTLSSNVFGVHARSKSDVWFATSTGLLHWNGTALQSGGPLGAGELYRVWSTAPNDIWAIGRAVHHFDGNVWSTVLPGYGSAAQYRGIWGTSSSNVWVGGGGSFDGYTWLSHWDGASWTTHVNPLGQRVMGLAGAGDRVWAIDQLGGIVRHRP
jgi:hypothetical protein